MQHLRLAGGLSHAGEDLQCFDLRDHAKRAFIVVASIHSNVAPRSQATPQQKRGPPPPLAWPVPLRVVL